MDAGVQGRTAGRHLAWICVPLGERLWTQRIGEDAESIYGWGERVTEGKFIDAVVRERTVRGRLARMGVPLGEEARTQRHGEEGT